MLTWGPGAGTSEHDRRYFDSKSYRIIMMDQRGNGKSTPFAELQDNNTWTLVEDIETLREHLAEEYPERVKALIVKGIFTLEGGGYSDYLSLSDQSYSQHENFLLNIEKNWHSFIKKEHQISFQIISKNLLNQYLSNDEEVEIRYTCAWCKWELSILRLLIDEEVLALFEIDHFILALAHIECHFMVHGGYFKSTNHILDNVEKIRHISGAIAWPEAKFHVVPDVGHNDYERGIIGRLTEATDKFRNI
ncbi:Proline iminopeptidase [Trichoplax sp. H2]|nr:Proline iminopeptidase [Trichoplax sp. H2]|eukprot:RDD45813.1 Proline iminopeptidase [Trichoplax sp. H2]